MFKELSLKAVYRSEDSNILKDFYLPTLAHSVQYDRAVGYFSAAALFSAAKGISALLENGGSMRLIIGGELSFEDVEAIETGYNVKELAESYGEVIVKEINSVVDSLFKRRMEALSLLVASGRLDIKIAYKPVGMYHEKIGILSDINDDMLVFQGSANETRYALLPDYNVESINVFKSWIKELEEHYLPYVDGFKRLWGGTAKNVRIAPFPEALRDKLVKISKTARPFFSEQELELAEKGAGPVTTGDEFNYDVEPRIPSSFKGQPFDLFDHQRKALNAWRANDFQGILELATGAGKTVTAITGIVKIFLATNKLCSIIAVPYQNLADQWVDDLKKFNICAIKCYGGKSSWYNQLSEKVTSYKMGSTKFICAVVVNRTLSKPHFKDIISEIPGENLLFVGDECHHHTSHSLQMSLPHNARMRLGLSATPWNHINSDLNDRLKDYYGDSVCQYTLKEALDADVLTKYRYHVVPVTFTDNEKEEYINLSKRIATLLSSDKKKNEKDSSLESLLLQRARIIGSAKNKFVELDKILANRRTPDKFSLFYCGDGTVENDVTGEEGRQIEQLSSLMHEHGWRTSRFTSRESGWTRVQILNQFRLGIIDSLVAIRCLDEGIDVPACRVAYLLASSSNPRQQVQRRGRILRKASGKDYAEIYDFIVQIPKGDSDTSKFERSLLKKELTRVAEFASLAINSGDVIDSLMPILEEYDLSHLLA